MNRISASYKRMFSLVQEHKIASTLMLLLVLLTPLAGLDAVQTMGDRIFYAATIEAYEVFDENCVLIESAITQRTGKAQHLAHLEEWITDEQLFGNMNDKMCLLLQHPDPAVIQPGK